MEKRVLTTTPWSDYPSKPTGSRNRTGSQMIPSVRFFRYQRVQQSFSQAKSAISPRFALVLHSHLRLRPAIASWRPACRVLYIVIRRVGLFAPGWCSAWHWVRSDVPLHTKVIWAALRWKESVFVPYKDLSKWLIIASLIFLPVNL